MATRAERQQALEALTAGELAAFRWAGKDNPDPDPAKRIAWILRDAETRNKYGDSLDRMLGLPTDAEQQLDLQRKALATSELSTQASWLSAHAAVLSVAISLVALIVAVIALVVALGESG